MLNNKLDLETTKRATLESDFDFSGGCSGAAIPVQTPIKLLLVDDNPEIIDVISEFLSFAGFFITPCQNGAEAINLLESSDFDVMVTDLQMPYLSGIELLDWMQANCPHVPVGVISGDLTVCEEDLREKGASFFLEKPFDLKLLVDEIHKIKK